MSKWKWTIHNCKLMHNYCSLYKLVAMKSPPHSCVLTDSAQRAGNVETARRGHCHGRSEYGIWCLHDDVKTYKAKQTRKMLYIKLVGNCICLIVIYWLYIRPFFFAWQKRRKKTRKAPRVKLPFDADKGSAFPPPFFILTLWENWQNWP